MMPLPTVYTTDTLADYIERVLGPTATALEWSAVGGDLAEIVNDTLLALGVTEIADVTDIAAIRAVARWQAWRWAADALASKYNVSTDGQSLARSQLYDQAVRSRDAAYQVCTPHLAASGVTATRIVHTDDPIDAPIRRVALRGW